MKRIIWIFFILFSLFFAFFCEVEVAGGTISGEHYYPHMVSLMTFKGDSKRFCGGAIINSRTVLTAAHCINDEGNYRNPTDLYVQLGTNDISDPENGITIHVSDAIVHPSWIPEKVGDKYINENDIALLFLENNITETESVRYLDLIAPNSSVSIGQVCDVAGWGYFDRTYRRDYKLRNIHIPIQESSSCIDVGLDCEDELMICAGSDGVDTCAGDSGSPLVYLPSIASRRWVGVGITSFGTVVCGDKRSMGVYTRLSSYIDWVFENTFVPDVVSDDLSEISIHKNDTGTEDFKNTLLGKIVSYGVPLLMIFVFGLLFVLCLLIGIVCLLVDAKVQYWRANDKDFLEIEDGKEIEEDENDRRRRIQEERELDYDLTKKGIEEKVEMIIASVKEQSSDYDIFYAEQEEVPI